MTDRPSEPWTLLRALNWTTERFAREGLESPRLDAELLLAHCLRMDRVRLYMEYEKPLSPGELARYRAAIQRRLAREPVAYITGSREFWSLPLVLSRGVLVPRPETETLVERALQLLAGTGRAEPVIVDVGTGSGAVALALTRELPGAHVVAVDIDGVAVDVARENARRLELSISVHRGDLLAALPDGLGDIDLVVANLPYVTTAELAGLQPEVSRWEPRGALDGGADGLALFRRLIPQAAERLAPGRAIALEIGCAQADAVGRLLVEHGFGAVQVTPDLAGLDRVVTATRQEVRPPAPQS